MSAAVAVFNGANRQSDNPIDIHRLLACAGSNLPPRQGKQGYRPIGNGVSLSKTCTIMGQTWLNYGFWAIIKYLPMLQTATKPMVSSSSSFGLFDNVPDDVMNFGRGSSFDPKLVQTLLGLKKEDISRIASVSVKSVRYDDAIPEQVRERLEEIGSTINMVAQAFGGDVEKTAVWFRSKNPMLGDVSPRDMIRLGRYDRLRKFIINAMMQRMSPQSSLAV